MLVAIFIAGGLIVPNLKVTWVGPNAVAERPRHFGPMGGQPGPGTAVNPGNLHPEEIYARAASVAAPSVVNIDTAKNVRVRRSFFDDDWFGGPRVQRVTGSGSGVIISSDGEIITNEHVVSGADEIKVTLHNGKVYPARVVGRDRSTDVALVRISGSGFPAVGIGSSRSLTPGQIAVAIGNPLGLRFTVTSGIVSALGRPVKINDRVYENLIQTDCAINPGNSGGALVDRDGKLIGLNTLVADQANGVGFAIPVDFAMRIAGDLRKFGKVRRPWTGLYFIAVNPRIQRYFGLPNLDGAFVDGIYPGSPAELAGIEPGDILLELNGAAIKDDDDLRRKIEALKIGQKVTFKLRRGEQLGRGEMVLREAP
jgi:S1-C subfamily serine protease